MKALVNGERKVIEQAGMSQYLFSLNFDLPQVGLSCFAKLKFEDEAFINNLYEELLNVGEIKLGENKMTLTKDGQQLQLNKYSLSTLVMDMVTQAMQNLTDKGRSLMVVYVDEEKDTLRKYREKTKTEINQLKEHIKNNEEKKKLLDIENKLLIDSIKNEEKVAYSSGEKNSKARSDDEVALTTTQKIKTQSETKKVPVSYKPRTTTLTGLIK